MHTDNSDSIKTVNPNVIMNALEKTPSVENMEVALDVLRQSAVKSDTLEILANKVHTYKKSGNLLARRTTEELYARMNLPPNDPAWLNNDQLIALHISEKDRDARELKDIMNLFKQQFINIKISGEPTDSSNNKSDSGANTSKLSAENVNNVRNIINFLSSKLNTPEE